MPRRERDTNMTSDTAGGSVDAASLSTTPEEPAPENPDQPTEPTPDQPTESEPPHTQAKAPKPPKPLGPMTTRTGAEALVIKAPNGQRVFTAGGDKGSKIAELLRTRPDMARKEIATLVGCSQSRVAEVARVLGIVKTSANGPAPTADAEPQPQPEASNA